MRAFPHSPPALLGCARNAPGKPTHSLPTRCTQLGSCAPARTLAAPASCSLRMAPSTLHSTHLHVGHLSATLCIDRLRLAAPAALELPPCKQPGGGVFGSHTCSSPQGGAARPSLHLQRVGALTLSSTPHPIRYFNPSPNHCSLAHPPGAPCTVPTAPASAALTHLGILPGLTQQVGKPIHAAAGPEHAWLGVGQGGGALRPCQLLALPPQQRQHPRTLQS